MKPEAERHPRDVRRRRSSPKEQLFDRVLVVGRPPAELDDSRARADARPGRTSAASSWSTSSGAPHEPSIFAIGDVVGEPMLAHKASHEGRVAVEVIAGENVAFAAARDSGGRLHRSRAGLGRPDRGAGAEGRPQGRGREVPVGRVGPRDHARSHRRPDQADSRSGDRTDPRRRPGRAGRRRADCRRRAGDRDGRERDRPEAVDPSAPDADRDADGVGRSVLRPGDARLPAETLTG